MTSTTILFRIDTLSFSHRTLQVLLCDIHFNGIVYSFVKKNRIAFNLRATAGFCSDRLGPFLTPTCVQKLPMILPNLKWYVQFCDEESAKNINHTNGRTWRNQFRINFIWSLKLAFGCHIMEKYKMSVSLFFSSGYKND